MKILCAVFLLSQCSNFLSASDLSTLCPNWSMVKHERLLENGVQVDTVENTVKGMDDKDAVAAYRTGLINRSYKLLFLLAFYGQSIISTTTDTSTKAQVFQVVYEAVTCITTYMGHYEIPMRNLDNIEEAVFYGLMQPESETGTLDTVGDYIKTQFPIRQINYTKIPLFILNTKDHGYNWDIYRSVMTDKMNEDDVYPPEHSDEERAEKRDVYFGVIKSLSKKVKQEYDVDTKKEEKLDIDHFYELNDVINKEEKERSQKVLEEKLKAKELKNVIS